MFTPRRVDSPELLDEGTAAPADVERSLRDLRRFNSIYGGARVYLRLLRRMVRNETVSILDVATGTADAPERLPGFRVGLDRLLTHLLYLRDHSTVRRVAGDALQLPFRDSSFEIVTSAHFFHHLTPEQNAAMLREAIRVARRGVIVNDTRRHYLPLFFVRLLALFRLVGPVTRNDAPASILRGYTLEEARAIGAKVPAARMEVVRLWPFRFGLLLWK